MKRGNGVGRDQRIKYQPILVWETLQLQFLNKVGFLSEMNINVIKLPILIVRLLLLVQSYNLEWWKGNYNIINLHFQEVQ